MYFNYYKIEININSKKAFKLFIDASKQNHILAQYFVGICYQYEYGITKNEKLAFEYYEKVANKDYAVSQLNLGYFYENGISIKKDLKMAGALRGIMAGAGLAVVGFFNTQKEAQNAKEKLKGSYKQIIITKPIN